MSRSQLDRVHGPNSRGDDTDCHILHVDMDAFFAAVELRTRPELVGRPVIIGHAGGRGVVLSATYEARALGVHSAMPMSRALRIAPTATVIPPSHGEYGEVSANVMEILRSYTPLVQPLSVDEAFLDVAGAVRRFGTPSQIGDAIRAQVWDEQGITCSVGIAPTMFVAKLATNYAKPNGLHVVPKDGVVAFLHPLSVSSLWGVGERTTEQLTRLGLRTVGDLANTPLRTLQKALGQASGAHLYDLAWGRDERTVVPEIAERSISNERTFAMDSDDPEFLLANILDLAEQVARRLRAAELSARTVSIKVRFTDFSTITRSHTMTQPTDIARDIYEVARRLFAGLGLQRALVRLVGVKAEGLVSAVGVQLELGARENGWREAESAMDQAAARFGKHAVKPARLIGHD